MKCSPKTMMGVALMLATAGVLVYLAFPAAQVFVVSSAPLFLSLICPLSMLVMMWTMRGGGTNSECGHDRASQQAPRAPLSKD